MPNKDGTGPQGQGPKTGRGLGNCNNSESNNQPPRQGFGRRRRGQCNNRPCRQN